MSLLRNNKQAVIKMKDRTMSTKFKCNVIGAERLAQAVFDSVAAKRQIKVGYVRQPGGLYPNECDTVGSHNYAVAILAAKMGYQLRDPLRTEVGVELDLKILMGLALFHDYGETRSLDTGAQIHALHDRGEAYHQCQLKTDERLGLYRNVEGLTIESTAMEDFDHYVKRDTPEAIIVGVCDALEGFEKALHAGARIPGIYDDAFRILRENIALYRGKAHVDETLGKVANYVVDQILLPGAQKIVDAYFGIGEIDVLIEIEKHVVADLAPEST